MKTRIVFIGFLLLFTGRQLHAIEGMWLPQLLKEINEDEMKSLGMRISAEDIYNINRSSLKDAIFRFGGGCTSELISGEGLLLTNHHCGFGQIQQHSSLENDYLKYGFWAKTRKDELPNPGLTATRIVRIQDVTAEVLKGSLLSNGEYDENVIKVNIERIESFATQGTHYGAKVKSFYYGNEYYLFVTETFTDVRLVGAPPSSVGNYGRDTDNWMWPRHNADFSMFRIYADKNNKPAEYSEDNVPYKPLHFLPVSMKGVKKNDFTMVFGFPGRTQEYLPSNAVDMIMNHINPTRIAIRTKSLEIIHDAMSSSDALRIMYAVKAARISNAWKKWQGESRGLAKLDALNVKKLLEEKYLKSVNGEEPYASVLSKFDKVYEELLPYEMANAYYYELLYTGAEMFRYASGYMSLVNKWETYQQDGSLEERINKLKPKPKRYFNSINLEVDKKLMVAVLPMFVKGIDPKKAPQELMSMLEGMKFDYEKFADAIYSTSIFSDPDRNVAWLDEMAKDPKKAVKKAEKDPLMVVTNDIYNTYFDQIRPKYSELNQQLSGLMRTYMRGLLNFLPKEKRYYPDANSTLRITYGKVEGYTPKDGVTYQHYTTIDGVMQKYVPGDDEFDLLPRFMELYEKKDYGRYGENGTLRVAFTASNHTTGGNSGSPVLNADGHLVGLNFDRAWESTMSDIMYDPERCRNIAVDIRYILWVIDKYAGAKHLVDEMKLID